MYFADTPTRSVYEIDYTENGKLTNRRNIYTQPPNLPGGPDGAQTDSEGFVWVALNGALDEWFELTRPTAVLMSLF